MPDSAAGLVADPAWRAEPTDDGVVLLGGADTVYLLPDVRGTVAAEVVALVGSGPVDDAALRAETRALLPQLRAAGVLRVALAPRAEPVAVTVRVVGAPAPDVLAELARLLPGTSRAPTSDGTAGGAPDGLVVVLRTTGRLRDLMDLAGELAATRTPHVLCDLANRSTLVLGPLVVPGLSACLACLAGRVGRRWGDPEPPASPALLAEAPLVAAVLHRAVRGVLDGDLALLERTVALDTSTWESTGEDVLPSADCPLCPAVDPVGIELPWEAG